MQALVRVDVLSWDLCHSVASLCRRLSSSPSVFCNVMYCG